MCYSTARTEPRINSAHDEDNRRTIGGYCAKKESALFSLDGPAKYIREGGKKSVSSCGYCSRGVTRVTRERSLKRANSLSDSKIGSGATTFETTRTPTRRLARTHTRAFAYAYVHAHSVSRSAAGLARCDERAPWVG